jgi:hypothetical protein
MRYALWVPSVGIVFLVEHIITENLLNFGLIQKLDSGHAEQYLRPG